jgi:non-specific serine/threonine protein kinase
LTETSSPSTPDALPIGTQLGDFKITNTIGFGGFGMVYLAYEKLLDRTVAIKEYLPVSIAGRVGDLSVRVRSLNQLETYEAGLRAFVREAQLQARFSHPAMLEVYRVWEQHGTAYMAMRFYPGTSLRDVRKADSSREGLSEAQIRSYLEPVLDAVRELHAHNVLHRDIAPDNILITSNETPVLLDFGAARAVIAGSEQQLTTVLKPGYAPIEQYADDGAMAQGPWTDIYALGAVMYYLVMGMPPPQPVSRMMKESIDDFNAIASSRYSSAFSDAVRRALAVKPEARWQRVEDFCAALGWEATPRTMFKTGVLLAREKTASENDDTKAASAPTSANSPRTTVARSEAAPSIDPPTELVSAPLTRNKSSAKKTRDPNRESTRTKPIQKTVLVPPLREGPRANEEIVVAKASAAAVPSDALKPGKTENAAKTTVAIEATKASAQVATQKPLAPPPAPVATRASRRMHPIVWLAVPALAVASSFLYKSIRAPQTVPEPQKVESTNVAPPQRAVDEARKTDNVKSVESPNATPSNAPVPTEIKPTTSAIDVPSKPDLRAVELKPPSDSNVVAPASRDNEKRKSDVVAASASDSKRSGVQRAKPTEDASARATPKPSAAACEELYAKLSLGTIELTAQEKSRLAACR